MPKQHLKDKGTQVAGDIRHNGGDQVVQVTEGGGGQLQSTEADIVQGLVVNAHNLISVLDKLVDGQSAVVGLDDGVGHLRGGHNGESQHHTVRVLLTDLGDQQSSHSGTGTTSQRVGDQETLQAVTALSLLTDNIQDGVDQLGALSVVALGPVVTSTSLSENEVVGTEDLAVGTSTDGVHGTRLWFYGAASDGRAQPLLKDTYKEE